jgi:hypothetical protein
MFLALLIAWYLQYIKNSSKNGGKERFEENGEPMRVNAKTFSQIGKLSVRLIENIRTNILMFSDKMMVKGKETLDVCTKNKKDITSLVQQIQSMKPKLDQIDSWSANKTLESSVLELKNALDMINAINRELIQIQSSSITLLQNSIKVRNTKSIQLCKEVFTGENKTQYEKNKEDAISDITQFSELRENL